MKKTWFWKGNAGDMDTEETVAEDEEFFPLYRRGCMLGEGTGTVQCKWFCEDSSIEIAPSKLLETEAFLPCKSPWRYEVHWTGRIERRASCWGDLQLGVSSVTLINGGW